MDWVSMVTLAVAVWTAYQLGRYTELKAKTTGRKDGLVTDICKTADETGRPVVLSVFPSGETREEVSKSVARLIEKDPKGFK